MVHLVLVAQDIRAPAILRGAGVDERVEVGMAAQHVLHLLRPAQFVESVGVVEVLADFVAEEPGQFAVDIDFAGVFLEALVEEGHAALHPLPAILEVLALDGDVVGHVPGLNGPNIGEMRLQRGDPIGQLDHFKIAFLLLQLVGPHPEEVGNQAAEAAEGDRREGQNRRGVGEHGQAREAVFVAVLVEHPLHLRGGAKQNGGQQRQGRLIESRSKVHAAPTNYRGKTEIQRVYFHRATRWGAK